MGFDDKFWPFLGMKIVVVVKSLMKPIDSLVKGLDFIARNFDCDTMLRKWSILAIP